MYRRGVVSLLSPFRIFPFPNQQKVRMHGGSTTRCHIIDKLLDHDLTSSTFSPFFPPQPFAELYIQGFEEALQLAAGGSRGQAIAVL